MCEMAFVNIQSEKRCRPDRSCAPIVLPGQKAGEIVDECRSSINKERI